MKFVASGAVWRAAVAVVLGWVALPASASLTVYLLYPGNGELSSNPLEVEYSIFSDSPIVSSSVTVADRTAARSTFPDVTKAIVTETLHLEGLGRGMKTIVATATNAAGETTQATRDTLYDGSPDIRILDPLDQGVARPVIHVRAQCADGTAQGCQSLIVQARGITVAEGVTSIDQDISLAAYEGTPVTLRILGRSSDGWYGVREPTVYVETSPRLCEVATFEGPILDVSSERVLFLHPDGLLRIHDRATGQRTVIPAMSDYTPLHGFLTARGAIFYAYRGLRSTCDGRIVEWRDGNLLRLDDTDGADSLMVGGDSAAWTTSDMICVGGVGHSLKLRNLATAETSTVEHGYTTYFTAVAPSGDLWYSLGFDSTLRRYRDGVSSVVVDGTRSFYATIDGVVADDINVAYGRIGEVVLDHGVRPYSTILVTDGSPAPLAIQTVDARKGLDYAVKGGWAAYTVEDTSASNKQVYARSPDGAVQKRSFAPWSWIDALGPTGGLMIVDGTKRYLTTPATAPQTIGSALGRSTVINGRWTVILGRMLFVVPMSLSVEKRGSGSGFVASAPVGIACGTECARGFDAPASLSLTATPDAGSQFIGWLGACSGRGPCTVDVGSDIRVTATFAPVTTPATIDIDGDGDAGALTDGLIVLRHLFGLIGEPLTRSAIGSGAIRSDPAAVAAWIEDIEPLLDIDGDGRVDALSDGLLLIRYLFGLRGDALVAAAIGPRATRTTAAQIELYLASIL